MTFMLTLDLAMSSDGGSLNSKAIPKSICCTYLVLNGRLPTIDKLKSFRTSLANGFEMCNQEEESINDLFVKCKITWPVWENIADASIKRTTTLREVLLWWRKPRLKSKWVRTCWRPSFPMMIWNTWKKQMLTSTIKGTRNNELFENLWTDIKPLQCDLKWRTYVKWEIILFAKSRRDTAEMENIV
ncbi:hypothetical protein EJ110_NYTH05396 [Nymphaea thermarum]|nr:hypothetical protein EJ110_NYTH05396 [Nymphaea thermarum]